MNLTACEHTLSLERKGNNPLNIQALCNNII